MSLTCSICFFNSNNCDRFIDHLLTVHCNHAIRDGDRLTCSLCNSLEFESTDQLIEHCIENHNQVDLLARFLCPFCSTECTNSTTLEQHAQSHVDEADATIAAKNNAADDQLNLCPICGEWVDSLPNLEEHITSTHNDCISGSSDSSADMLLAVQLQNQEEQLEKRREEMYFKQLQAEYGMDPLGSGGYRQQASDSLQKQLNRGQIDLADFYDAKIELIRQQTGGYENSDYPVKGLIEKIKQFSHLSGDVVDAAFSSDTDHFSTNFGDRGFGCGYRNAQMLLSSLKRDPLFNDKLKFELVNSDGIPSIPRLQRLIENAWKMGFDFVGRDQLNGKLIDTHKWIGATEIAALLQSFYLKVQIIDFHCPTGPNRTHPALFDWVWQYFVNRRSYPFCHPLYLQHEGHSRTIVGIESLKNGQKRLLLFDPSHWRSKMSQLLIDQRSASVALRLLRKCVDDLRKPKFQIVAVLDVIRTKEEYEGQKRSFNFVKIP